MTNRLTPDDWIAAGFLALAQGGPEAVKAEPLARRLKTSKGSFYHHFKDVPAFHAAMLALWQDKAATGIIAALDALPDPQTKLRRLAQIASTPAPDRFGGQQIEPALRAWSLRDAAVASAVADVDQTRIAYVADLFQALGKPPSHALIFYGAYVGLDDLAARDTPRAAPALSNLVEMLLR